MSDSEKKPEQNYKIITPAGEKIFTVPGNRGPQDMRIYSIFPTQPWATTLCYIGCVLRLKGIVEDRNYKTGYGHGMLAAFIVECICHPEKSIKELCSKYKITLQEKDDGFDKQKDNRGLTEAVNSFWKSQSWE